MRRFTKDLFHRVLLLGAKMRRVEVGICLGAIAAASADVGIPILGALAVGAIIVGIVAGYFAKIGD